MLRENQTPIIFFAPDSGFYISMMDTIKNYKNNGMNAYLMETDYTANAHIMTNRDVLTNGMLEYLLGYSDSFDQTRAGGYEIFCYNSETGQFENASMSDMVNSNVHKISIPNLNQVNLVDDFQIVSCNSPVCEKYASLKNLSNVSISAGSSRTISSSFSYVANNMNHIRTQIKKSSFLSTIPNIGTRSSSGIPGCIAEYLNTYFDFVGNVVNSISMETESIISYAQAVEDLDNDLANGIKSGDIFYHNDTSNSIGIGLEPKKEEVATNPPVQNHNANNTFTYPSNNNVYVGGGSSSGNNTSNNASTLPVAPLIVGGLTRAVVKLKDGGEGIVCATWGKVDQVKIRFQYLDNQDALNHLDEIKEKFKKKFEEKNEKYEDYIQDIVIVDEKYIDVIYKEECYKDMTESEAIKKFFEGDEIDA